MPDILAITAPIYALIALGWAAVRFGAFPADGVRPLGLFALRFALPALLFDAIVRRGLGDAGEWRYLAAYASGSLAVLAAGFWWMRRRGASVSLAAVQAMGMCSSNSAFVGYPILQQWLGAKAAVLLALTMLVENLLVLPAALAAADAETGRGWRHALATGFAGLARNPLVIAIGAGFVVALAGWTLPPVASRTVALVGEASAAVALFVVGASLVGQRIAGVRAGIAQVAIGKLVVHPAAVAAAVWLFAPADPTYRAAAVVLAAMPMLGIYPVLAQRHGHAGFAAATLLVTTLASFATISLLLGVVAAR